MYKINIFVYPVKLFGNKQYLFPNIDKYTHNL